MAQASRVPTNAPGAAADFRRPHDHPAGRGAHRSGSREDEAVLPEFRLGITLGQAVETARHIVAGRLVRARLDADEGPVWQVVLRTEQGRLVDLLIDAGDGRVLGVAWLPRSEGDIPLETSC